MLEQAKAAVRVLSELVSEAQLIVSTAHQANAASRPGDTRMLWGVDLARLGQLVMAANR